MISRRSVAAICLALVCAAGALPAAPPARAQAPQQPGGEILASLKFDPKVHGFGFRNFENYRLRLLLRCGAPWQHRAVAPIRPRHPRVSA